MDINFSSISLPDDGSVVFLVTEELVLPPLAVEIDKKTGGAITKAITSSDFTGKSGKFISILATIGLSLDRVVLVGIGKDDDELTEAKAQDLGATVNAYLNNNGVDDVFVVVDENGRDLSSAKVAANFALGMKLRHYRFNKYYTKDKDKKEPKVKSATFMLDSHSDAATHYEPLDAVAEGVYLARDLVSEPPNVLYPGHYADLCKELKQYDIKVEVLGEKEMRKLGMESLLAVGQGSAKESYMVVMQWLGAGKKDEQPLAFVGKGVCFDSGGISLKPGKGMEDMKYDMGGSAAVVGLMKTLAMRKAKVNAIGVVGLVENMPGSNAQRPSDVITSMSGQTIEVINTDAEGRLVLADALWYTQDKFNPKFMINLATLTGAIVVALGGEHAGVFSNDDELSVQLEDAGKASGERVWRLPLNDNYDKQINSKIADMRNTSTGRGAGSITAAQFLQRFVNDVPWVHIDIAGMAWSNKANGVLPGGATGYGVRLLNQLVKDNFE